MIPLKPIFSMNAQELVDLVDAELSYRRNVIEITKEERKKVEGEK